MTDAPGEWFRTWALNRDAAPAEGARWAAEHADALLLIADRGALAGPDRGAARTDVQLLARRLAAELRERPVALVWTKSDITVDDYTEQAVRNTVLRSLPSAAEFRVSVAPTPDTHALNPGLADLLAWVLNTERPTMPLPEPTAGALDQLLMTGAR